MDRCGQKPDHTGLLLLFKTLLPLHCSSIDKTLSWWDPLQVSDGMNSGIILLLILSLEQGILAQFAYGHCCVCCWTIAFHFGLMAIPAAHKHDTASCNAWAQKKAQHGGAIPRDVHVQAQLNGCSSREEEKHTKALFTCQLSPGSQRSAF